MRQGQMLDVISLWSLCCGKETEKSYLHAVFWLIVTKEGLEDSENGFTLGDDECPETLQKELECLMNYKKSHQKARKTMNMIPVEEV